MQRHLARPSSLLAGLAGLGALAACDSDPYDGPVIVGPQVTVIGELEPNNSAATAVGVGPIGPFDDLILTGWVSGFDGFGADGVDGWALQSQAPIRIDFALEDTSVGVHDLDLCLYDPYSDSYVQCFESFGNEYGTIFVYAPLVEFHLVVIAYNASSSYDLRLSVSPLSLAATDLEGESPLRSADGTALDESRAPRARASQLYLEGSFGKELDASLLNAAEPQLDSATIRVLEVPAVSAARRE